MIRYRFSDFTLSPRQRLLVRDGREVPLIPRYLDLLILLVEHRHEAVHRREIFERVWADGVVSESALSQAVRTLRRTLGDDSKEPRFIRTVSRHGYRFVFPDVIEEEEGDAALAAVQPALVAPAAEPRVVPARWAGAAAAGGALAGVAAGGIGGLILAAVPGSVAPFALAPVLAVIGGGCGAIGGAGVGVGLGLAEAAAQSQRTLSLMAAAASGGGLVGLAVQWLTGWGLAALFGVHIDIGGVLEGVVIGGAAGLGLSLATWPTDAGLPVPRRGKRLTAALITAACCGTAGLALTVAGRPLAGGTIHAIATAAEGSRATLAPLGRLIGEPDFGPVSRATIAFGESAVFGLGLAFGLVRRPDGEG